MAQALTDKQRRLIHDLALEGRALLTREAQELLEGVYGLYPDGHLDPPGKLPQVQNDPDTGETYQRLAQFLADEAQAGLPRPEAVTKLVKEIAFTHLNRLVAFKMMEARKLIRGTLDKGLEANAFKFYLADPEHAADYVRYQQGEAGVAYRHFLLWQAGQVAQEVRVLFDPDTLPSRLFPRPRALQTLIDKLNQPELDPCWQADETIGWLYQYFNEQEKAQVFERLYKQKQKIRRQDLPAATQLFTPHWIVRFLVQNTLGRLWVQMHPDTHLVGTELLDYLVPLPGDVPPEPLRPISEVTLLDPACGTMHFGLVAFDLFAAMYREELARAGEPGWLDTPAVSDPADIPAAIIKNNLFGLDIDLRAVQLSALSLYLKAKALNKGARISDSNLACVDVLPLNGARLGKFLKEARFTQPIYERLIRGLWDRLKDLNEIGSLLRLEEELAALIAEERARYEKAPLFAGLAGEFEREAAEEEFWHIIAVQVIQGLDEFARQQAEQGQDVTFFVGEATKGLRILDLMSRRYDVVVSNPPYSGSKNLSGTLSAFLSRAYPLAKADLFSAFIARCGDLVREGGRLGMLTIQSFMFLSSFKKLREWLNGSFAIEVINHLGTRTIMDLSNPNAQGFTAFCMQYRTPSVYTTAACLRLVNAPGADGKREAFEYTLQNGNNFYSLAPHRFKAIPDSPWIYWLSDRIRGTFETGKTIRDFHYTCRGIQTSDNPRFIRYWWEVGQSRINTYQMNSNTNTNWFPYMKGGEYKKWYGNQEHILNWGRRGEQLYAFRPFSVIRNADLMLSEGMTFSSLTVSNIGYRYMPSGYFWDQAGSALIPKTGNTLANLAALNSTFSIYLTKLVSPTVNYTIGDIGKTPFNPPPPDVETTLSNLSVLCIQFKLVLEQKSETVKDFIVPPCWGNGLNDLKVVQNRLMEFEQQINDVVYRLYGLSDEDRAVIEAELAGDSLLANDDNGETENIDNDDGDDEPAAEAPMTAEELAVRWISYAVGIVLGHFQPGLAGELGSAVYRRSDFAVGSLPEPDETEFDQLVGPPERFAYLDAEGGRHRFSAEVEIALRELAVPDGITVLDPGHPRDLTTLVEKALTLMLGPEATQAVIAAGANGDLRKFLERDYFTKWHLTSTWYRKRPVYWPLQSAKRSYGFVIFHERIDKSTLYVLQRDYLDHKLNGLRLHTGDLQGQMEGQTGSARKKTEREIDKTTQLLDELTEFAQTIERLVRQGYEPEENWIDDGVILRLAPLWELLPIWKSEPKKYWQRLQNGDFDWSHMAMHYWPERVKEKCKTNKSFAIAHGHEAWYEGNN